MRGEGGFFYCTAGEAWACSRGQFFSEVAALHLLGGSRDKTGWNCPTRHWHYPSRSCGRPGWAGRSGVCVVLPFAGVSLLSFVENVTLVMRVMLPLLSMPALGFVMQKSLDNSLHQFLILLGFLLAFARLALLSSTFATRVLQALWQFLVRVHFNVSFPFQKSHVGGPCGHGLRVCQAFWDWFWIAVS